MRTRQTLESMQGWVRDNTPSLVMLGSPSKTKEITGWECRDCGFHWESTFNRVQQRPRCPRCSRKKAKRESQHLVAYNKAKRWTVDKVNDELLPRGIQTPDTSFFELKSQRGWNCLICGHSWETTGFQILYHKAQCPQCRKAKGAHNRLPLEEILFRLQDRFDLKYFDGYTDSMTKCSWECNVCGGKWEASPHNIFAGQGCPQCASSKGEKQIASLLEELGIQFTPQWGIRCPKEVRARRWVWVDFYLEGYKCVVEYHGRQHFEESPYFHRKDGDFQRQQIRDEWVRTYCLQNDLQLLEIPYTCKDIKSEILSILSTLTLDPTVPLGH